MSPKKKVTLGSVLRDARIASGLSQTELAERAGIASNHVARLESGEKINIRFKTIAYLASALGVSLDQLAARLGYGTLATFGAPIELPKARFAAVVNNIRGSLASLLVEVEAALSTDRAPSRRSATRAKKH